MRGRPNPATPAACRRARTAWASFSAKNRLTISVNFTIFISQPKEDKMILTSTRFSDYDSSSDLASIESQLLEEINKQIVQDLINKLFSNW